MQPLELIDAKSKLSYPRVCGLLAGNPTRLSQAMHSAGFAKLGLPFVYVAFATDDTLGALGAMKLLGFQGLSLTIPHKELAVELVDTLSEEARIIGAVNTVINCDGKLCGYNTDWFGVVQAIAETSFNSKDSSALVFGAGGAARAAIYALKHLSVSKIYVANRNADRAQKLANEFEVIAVPLSNIEELIMANQQMLFINSTPLAGVSEIAKDSAYPFPINKFSEKHYVFDMVTRETGLLAAARPSGAVVIPGSRMLLHQGVMQFELFTGQAAPFEVMEKALAEAIAEMDKV